jgi:acid phosphatase family membrane protein YuiD
MGWWLVVPLAYLLAGATKFAVNSLKARRLAFDGIGLGGLPSTHTAIVSAPAWLLLMTGKAQSELFALALALVAVVVIDAMDLRRKLEKVHAILRQEFPQSASAQGLREKVGHRPIEIIAGLAVGAVAAALVVWALAQSL